MPCCEVFKERLDFFSCHPHPACVALQSRDRIWVKLLTALPAQEGSQKQRGAWLWPTDQWQGTPSFLFPLLPHWLLAFFPEAGRSGLLGLLLCFQDPSSPSCQASLQTRP